MMATYFSNRSKSKFLTAQIRDAERQVMYRRQAVGDRYATLVQTTHQQMTAPASLLLAAGIGFIIGELTRRQSTSLRIAADKAPATETTPLTSALNLFTTVRTLYMALPLAWLMKLLRSLGAPGPAPEPQSKTHRIARTAAS
ncbi:hypothetical protein [Methylococcus sp. EFPC2]|uniref:hypothetical protein n=1 Tax=Methylococcus sp. EFPC2 TaxID=2812648 RepID=UPI0019682C6F|nr:hypothetical protein [Methylococcus sp. EFPC2]QSA97745.1 hypothetical protein JWZ97_02620 [Methylococcus sp. EFPC2]